MKTNFFNFWVRNTKTSFLFIALIVFAGLFSLMTIPKESSPDIKFGIISITTAYPGVNPEDIDSLITEKVEREIENLDGIKKITSTSSVGFSNTTVELYNGVNTREVLTDIKDKIDNLDLPEDALDPSVVEVSSNNELMFEVLLYGDAEEYDNFSLMTKAKRIQNKLEGKYGITSIDIGGLDNRNWSNASSSASDYKIKVLLDKQKVELLGLSIHGVASQIQAFNKNTPIGNFRVGDLNYDFRFDGELTNIEELKQVVIRDTGTSKILLSDIATITREYADTKVRRLGFYNETGYNYVSLIFNKKNGANIFSVADEAKAGLEQLLHAEEFQGLGVKYSKDMSELIIEDYKNLGQT
ncbi:MAG: efflux RND transporter permease subunit [Candidatus Peribacteria bacterium]|nr:MAG: efflux RND transporter permease subunit [Candidatus Peribacteria bacterium]